ncbi:TIM barrel protein [Serratia quinivorans]|uniref:TIM barrel protein n=1 Tax=Serratia quinivorans TaxID=137545 RepID=UPI00217BC7B2|nr:TIM barrel protein [Serratia quinivorans]CAI0817922.1 Hydroxypyruvate isomerase [Serratia quinivorans]CAI0820555.1 Hydroxypyruvate isomerase [Serratia quinivorans]CAI0843466.1 Hydroxypyruvate isomerase [Serratia quinivorans]CAI1497466.1 Hydroxypyruvate isomerase [Serratia quinivorans]CAI2036053.1 Hydroxypyruvate isomerase [Serratia quinivorans]
MASFQLSVCAEMVFLDLPFVERVARIDALGFGVEIWNWANKDLDALVATGARFTSMTGYLSGNLTDEEEIAQLLQSAEQSLAVAQRLNCPSLNLHGTGLDSQGLPVKPMAVVTGAMWLKAANTLTRLAHMGEAVGKVFTLENLNLPLDHPGTPFAKADDTLALVEAVNRPGLKMNLDLYHAQIGEGNLIELIRRCGPAIGEIQVADVPGRKQPGTGEINYRAIARALDEIGYQGVVAMEGWASGDSTEALQQFRDHFTL